MDSAEQLHLRARFLVDEFKRRGETSCIDEAIDLDREVLELHPPGHIDRSIFLTALANDLGDRYSQLGSMMDLEETIVLGREALDLSPQGHPDRSLPLNNLAAHLSTRYNQLGVMEDLDEAIVLSREALHLRPQGHPDRLMSLNNLGIVLSSRYDQIGIVEDLDEAIVLSREALDLCPQGHPDRLMSLNNLGIVLSTRYNQLGIMEDLDEAIVLGRDAIDLCPKGHPDRSMSLDNLAVRLSTRYKRLGIMENLSEAIVLGREALDLRPKGHPERSKSLNNLAARLSTQYKHLGIIGDLDESIVLSREALALLPTGHPGRSMSLSNLAVHLTTRYKQFGIMQDLDEAIVLDRAALDLRPKGHPERSMSLDNLAGHLSVRYGQLGVMEDLEEAIVLSREAVDLFPNGHPERSKSLNNLALCLSTRYNQLGIMEDLDEAIVLDREAHYLRPKGHPERSMSLNNLALCLSTRYNQLGVMKDLNEAIVLDREALDLQPQGHPDWSTSLDNLARHLCDRYTRLRRSKDKEELFKLYSQLVHLPPNVSSSDLSTAKAWIRVAENFQHPSVLLAYETSLRLLIQHLTILPSLPRHLVTLKDLTSSLAVDVFSTCLRHRSPAKAVELLEQGRGVFWSQLTRLRPPLDDVISSGAAGKTMADEFTHLASLLRHALDSPGANQHEELCHLNVALQKVVTNIRNLPGLSRFLLPSLFSDLQCVASGGPVIIVNASKYSCDVLVILLDRDPVHVPLQMTLDDVQDLSKEINTLTVRARKADVTRELAAFLRKLWDHIVSSIVDVLLTTHPRQSRIWWCPTADFSALPLHAAGPYRKGQLNLPDLYISSYTPTLTTLIRSRQYNPSTSTTQGKRFVAIGQAKAAGEIELPSVSGELDIIGQRVDALATFTRIDGETSCIPRVVNELGKNEWVHLACHSLLNRTQPFESAFALRDGYFTIQRIIGCDLKNPEFAYLSASHTTVGDEESPDEVIHLASAMQFVGFRSVIGTMWAVDDGETNKITSTFYKHMVDESGCLDHTRAAYALNKTMKSVRIPLDQRILYIHLGA
ncbi:TPR-like protein [Boletus edulis]|nr:TPR-like protein [Boletus edulis]